MGSVLSVRTGAAESGSVFANRVVESKAPEGSLNHGIGHGGGGGGWTQGSPSSAAQGNVGSPSAIPKGT